MYFLHLLIGLLQCPHAINRTASVSSCSKESCTACMAISTPAICPAHNCFVPVASCMPFDRYFASILWDVTKQLTGAKTDEYVYRYSNSGVHWYSRNASYMPVA